MFYKILTFLLCIFTYSLAAEPLILGLEDKANSPYYFASESALRPQNQGILPELILLAAKHLNIELELQRHSWLRLLYLAKHNMIDGIIDVNYQEKREKYLVFPMKENKEDSSLSLTSRRYYLYALKESNIQWDGVQLTSSQQALPDIIAVQTGYSISHILSRLGKRIEPEFSLSHNLRKLLAKRVMAIAEIEGMMQSQLDEHPKAYANIVRLEPAIMQRHYYLAFSHKMFEQTPELAKRFWDKLKQLQLSQEYQGIVDKYKKLDGN